MEQKAAPMKIAINGFGRIGRNLFKAIWDNVDLECVAVNDLADAKILAHLLKYDSVHGRSSFEVSAEKESLLVNGKAIRVTAEKDPARLPWKERAVDLVVESTGLFSDRASAIGHFSAGARKVIISAPAKNPDITIVMGVNEGKYNPDADHLVSNASCTTNCLAPISLVLLKEYGIKRGLMTTIHSYTNDQSILDLSHKDPRRARAAALSMIPTTTGAAIALSEVIPELLGKVDGMAIRVPTPNVSIVDLVIELESDVTESGLRELYRRCSENEMAGIIQYTEEPLVSIDLTGNSHSAIVDGTMTKVIGKRMAKVLAWYDNEWGYACRLRDLMLYMKRKELI